MFYHPFWVILNHNPTLNQNILYAFPLWNSSRIFRSLRFVISERIWDRKNTFCVHKHLRKTWFRSPKVVVVRFRMPYWLFVIQTWKSGERISGKFHRKILILRKVIDFFLEDTRIHFWGPKWSMKGYGDLEWTKKSQWFGRTNDKSASLGFTDTHSSHPTEWIIFRLHNS